jgi:hypothetical protein
MSLVVATKKKRDFDPKRFLATIGEGRRNVRLQRNKQFTLKAQPVMQCFTSGKAR